MARHIAIDLGAYAVKVSVSQRSGDVDDVELEVRRRVPQDGSDVPTLQDRLAILDLLVRQHPDLVSTSHLCALAWPTERTTTQRLVLPFTDAEQVAKTLPFAIEDEVPLDLEDLVLAWRAGEGEGEILATLADRAELSGVLEGLAERGLDPRRALVDGDIIAAYGRGPGITAVVDVGHTQTTVTVARAGRPLATRAVGVAGRALTRAIQQALGCSWQEAELLKHGGPDEDAPLPPAFVQELGSDDDGPVWVDDELQPSDPGFGEVEDPTGGSLEATDPGLGALTTLPAKAKEAMDAVLGLLLAEVRATLVQAEDDLGVEIDVVVLTGGGARVDGLRAYLEEDLGLPVREAVDAEGQPVPDAYTVARALGELVVGDPSAATDLRVGDLAFRGGMDLQRTILQYGAAMVATYLVAVLAFFAWNMVTLAREQAAVDARIREAVAAVVPDAPLDELDASGAVGLLGDLVYDAQEQVDFLGRDGEAPPTVHLLYRLTTGFPPHPDVKVDVDRIDIAPKAIHLEGVVDDFSDVDKIGEALKAKGGFGGVDASPGKKKRDKLEFAVDIARAGADGDDDTGVDEEEG
ncbi:MAG: hypothetical protein H6732_17570 [Alphaproteobacteria bacterium]|nr:hypothetical protein [Alphaproteobacteria bacterium]